MDKHQTLSLYNFSVSDQQRFEIKLDSSHTPGSGVASMMTWKNDDLVAALKRAFGVKSNERIIGLTVDGVGITAYFKTVK